LCQIRVGQVTEKNRRASGSGEARNRRVNNRELNIGAPKTRFAEYPADNRVIENRQNEVLELDFQERRRLLLLLLLSLALNLLRKEKILIYIILFCKYIILISKRGK